MNKLVNIYPSRAIMLNPPIRCITKKVTLSEDYIKICLDSGAVVEEILDNKIIILNADNYNKDNSVKEVTKEETIVEQEEKAVEEKIEEIDAKVEYKQQFNKKNKHNKKYNNYQKPSKIETETVAETVEETTTEDTSEKAD